MKKEVIFTRERLLAMFAYIVVIIMQIIGFKPLAVLVPVEKMENEISHCLKIGCST